MATRIVCLRSQETAVTDTEDQVVQAVRGGHSNPVEVEGIESVLYVNSAQVTSIGSRPSP